MRVVPPITAAVTPASSGSSSATLSAMASGTGQQFMQILAAQMQYQDPLQPVSSTQMVAQLMQYEELDALLQIEKELAPGAPAAGASAASAAQGTGTSAASTGTGTSSGTAPASAGTAAKP